MIAIDCETKCSVPTCTQSDCKHALTPHTAEITLVATYAPDLGGRTFRSLAAVKAYLDAYPNRKLIAHNGKFDMRMLRYHGVKISLERWAEDSCLAAVASYEKIPQEYLEEYERIRQVKNRALKKAVHRPSRQHSLKTLAPWFLDVDWFWEVEDHNNEEYALKDAKYCYDLFVVLKKKLEKQGTWTFYKEKLLPWAKMFLQAEERGIYIDIDGIKKLQKEKNEEIKEVEKTLRKMWEQPAKELFNQQVEQVSDKYRRMLAKAIQKSKKTDPEIKVALTKKYMKLLQAALVKIDQELILSSPKQLLWILKDYYGLNTKNFKNKESTDSEVLERLAKQDKRADCSVLLKYRELEKLLSSYFPIYDNLPRATIHASFNLDIARTGRTSSSGPNLQQVPPILRSYYIARPGYKLLTLDLAAIEPLLIAYYSEDERLCKLMLDHGDFHSVNTNLVFEKNWAITTMKKEHKFERDLAKEFGLSVLYGARGRRVQASARKRGQFWNKNKCDEMVQKLLNGYPGVVAFKKKLDQRAERRLPIVNLFGRKRYFDNPDDIYMKNFNGLIQGSGSDLLLQWAHKCSKVFGNKGHLLMTVHDELVFEVLENEAQTCYDLAIEQLQTFKLETKWGRLPLRAEGGISNKWEK